MGKYSRHGGVGVRKDGGDSDNGNGGGKVETNGRTAGAQEIL